MGKWTTLRAAAAALRVVHLPTAPTTTTLSWTALCAAGWVHFRLSSGLVFDDHCAALSAPSGSVFDYQVGSFWLDKNREYQQREAILVAHVGSPPRVGGIRGGGRWRKRRYRFTPTRVGNTARRRSSAVHVPVHPHACGEYAPSPLTAPTVSGSPPRVWEKSYALAGDEIAAGDGSPPRVWGIQRESRSPGPQGRFTPTRVGNTRQDVSR